MFFGRLTLLDPADTSFLWGCFTAAMTASPRGRGRGGVRGAGRATDQSVGMTMERSGSGAAPRCRFLSGQNMFVQEDDGKRGEEFRRPASLNPVAVLLLLLLVR